MAKRPHPNDDQRGKGYLHALVVKKAANAANGGGSAYVADWSVVDCRVLGKLVWAVNVQGGSCLFGQTRNAHTLTFSVFSGNDKANWYFEQTDEGMDEFYSLAESIIEAALNSPAGLECPYKGIEV